MFRFFRFIIFMVTLYSGLFGTIINVALWHNKQMVDPVLLGGTIAITLILAFVLHTEIKNS